MLRRATVVLELVEQVAEIGLIAVAGVEKHVAVLRRIGLGRVDHALRHAAGEGQRRRRLGARQGVGRPLDGPVGIGWGHPVVPFQADRALEPYRGDDGHAPARRRPGGAWNAVVGARVVDGVATEHAQPDRSMVRRQLVERVKEEALGARGRLGRTHDASGRRGRDGRGLGRLREQAPPGQARPEFRTGALRPVAVCEILIIRAVHRAYLSLCRRLRLPYSF